MFRLLVTSIILAHLATPAIAYDGDSKVTDPLTTYDPHLYLFVDDHWIAQQLGLRRIVNQAQPLDEPIISPDDPRTETDFAWGNVIRESDGQFRLWYGTMMMGSQGIGAHEMATAGVWGRGSDFSFQPRSKDDVREVDTMLGKYAESSDGIHWAKPNLGLLEFRGSKDNNIVLNGEGPARQTDGMLTNFDGYTIVRDDDEPDADKRYKMIAHWESVHCWDNHDVSGSLERPKEIMDRYWAARGEYITFSPDGLNWNQPLVRINFPSGGGDRMLVIPDHRHDRWMAYTRAGGWAYPAFSYSKDLIEWSDPEPARHINPESVRAPAVECMIPFNYGSLDLGFPCGMDKPRGLFNVLLAARQENKDWEWVESQQSFIPQGPPGSYYGTGAVPLHNEPIIVGDEMLIYFNAFSRDKQHPCPKGSRSIGVAKLRRDGFVGLTAADGEGALTTRPISIARSSLMANVQLRGESGHLEVALFDESGAELPGYGFSESQAITEDSVRARVAWKNKSDVRELHGKHVHISVRLRGAAVLYALAFE